MMAKASYPDAEVPPGRLPQEPELGGASTLRRGLREVMMRRAIRALMSWKWQDMTNAWRRRSQYRTSGKRRHLLGDDTLSRTDHQGLSRPPVDEFCVLGDRGDVLQMERLRNSGGGYLYLCVISASVATRWTVRSTRLPCMRLPYRVKRSVGSSGEWCGIHTSSSCLTSGFRM